MIDKNFKNFLSEFGFSLIWNLPVFFIVSLIMREVNESLPPIQSFLITFFVFFTVSYYDTKIKLNKNDIDELSSQLYKVSKILIDKTKNTDVLIITRSDLNQVNKNKQLQNISYRDINPNKINNKEFRKYESVIFVDDNNLIKILKSKC
ncbi:MAG: hypothetical protein ACOCVF_01245 [bacterium]